MLSGDALDLAFTLRDQVGPLQQGVGVSAGDLLRLMKWSADHLRQPVSELESVGFVAVDRASAAGDSEISAVIVLAPLQIYLEDLEHQDSED